MRRMGFAALFFAGLVFFSVSLPAQAAPQPLPQATNMRALIHLDARALAQYTDTTVHDRFSHACELALGKERYAAIGTLKGTVILRYTDYVQRKGGASADPLKPRRGAVDKLSHVGPNRWFIEGARSQWRECRTLVRENVGYVYVVTEGMDADVRGLTLNAANPGGLQIIRIENGRAPVLANTYVDKFNSAHTIFIRDTLAFVNGAGWYAWGDSSHRHMPSQMVHLGGMRILSLADPEHPVDLGGFGDVRSYPEGYTHDSYAYGGYDPPGKRVICNDRSRTPSTQPCPSVHYIVYSADIYNGWIRVLDTSDPERVRVLDSIRTPLAAKGAQYSAHNIWMSADGKWLFGTEETKGSGLEIFSNENPLHPVLVATYRSRAVGDSSIAHNVVVRGNLAFVAWYTEGLRVIDISDPRNPREVAFYDTSDMDPNNATIFGCSACQGNWSVVVDSEGYVLIVDMQNGFYILELDQSLKRKLK
jgi:hypothetical protein